MHRVSAIRNHPKVGRGSCTSIDECFTDQEVIDSLDGENVQTCEGAVKWALESEGLWLEQGLNCRWGDDDDQQLIAWQEWNKGL